MLCGSWQAYTRGFCEVSPLRSKELSYTLSQGVLQVVLLGSNVGIFLLSSVSILVARTLVSSAQSEPAAKTCISFSSALVTFTSESVLVEIMNFSAKSFFFTSECSSIYVK